MNNNEKSAKVISLNAVRENNYNAEKEREENVIGRRITEARTERGISIAGLSRLLQDYGVSVTAGSVNKWEKGGSITAYQLMAVAQALSIGEDMSFFMSNPQLSLNFEGMKKVADYKADLIATGKYKPRTSIANNIRYIEMPVSNLRASAGTGSYLDEGNFEMVSFPEASVPAGADFGVRVAGDSMEPVYHDGQIVWVHQCETIGVGEVGIFTYDGEGYIKVYGEQEPDEDLRNAFVDSYGVCRKQPVMISYNKEYAPRVIAPDAGFQLVGRVL